MDQQGVKILDLAVDILRGCKWNCTGCLIDKEGQNGFLTGDVERLEALVGEFQALDFQLGNLVLGPTDFMSSFNSEATLNPELQRLAKPFDYVVVNSTLLEDDDAIIHWGKRVNETFPGKQIKLSIPFEPKHYKNEKYVSTMRRKRRLFSSQLTDAKYKRAIVVVNAYEYKLQQNPFNNHKVNFLEYSKEFFKVTGGDHIDFTITEGRLDTSADFNKHRLASIFRYYNDLFNQIVDGTPASLTAINFTYGKPHEGTEWRRGLMYRNGKLYFMVYIGELIPIFEDSYAIPNDEVWNMDTYIKYRNKFLVESLNYVSETDDCSSCEFVNHCVSRGTIKVMKTCGVKDCLAPRKAFTRTRDTSNYLPPVHYADAA